MLQNSNFITKSILTLIGIMFVSLAFAQDYMGDPKADEKVIGTVTGTINVYGYDKIYVYLLEKAKKEYPNKVIDLRNVYGAGGSLPQICSAKVVQLYSPETKMNETLVKAVDRALSNVRTGSRVAIEQISVSGGADRRKTEDQLIDILLEKGYRVVAKEFLENLKEEHERQQSGGFNEKTTAKTNNLSGIGYFLNIRVTENSIRIQVVNVSTGEYEGNTVVDY